MKIADVKSFLVHPAPHTKGWNISKNLLLVRVETDEGIVGIGETEYTKASGRTTRIGPEHQVGASTPASLVRFDRT